MASSNSFTSAFRKQSNLTYGDNGALELKTSGSRLVDYFTNLLKDTPIDNVKSAVQDLVSECESIKNEKVRGQFIHDIFMLALHKRGTSKNVDGELVSDGEGIKNVVYEYILELYNYYPQTIISIMTDGSFFTYGYWKDLLNIWVKINQLQMTDMDRYVKYNQLIEAFRDAMINQRTEDLRVVYTAYKGTDIKSMKRQRFMDLVSSNPVDFTKVSQHRISLVGKYLVREGTSFDKKAFWYRNEGIPMAPSLKKESHTNFMIRANLKKRTVNNSTIEYPSTKDVPYGAKAMWRHDNVKLNVVCDIVESYQCDKQYSKIKPSSVPSVALKRGTKAFLNETKNMGRNAAYYEDTGDRHPDNEDRVACRKNFRDHLTSGKKVNASQLYPNQVIGKIENVNGMSTLQRDMTLAQWDSLKAHTKEKMQAIVEELSSSMDGSPSSSISAGRFIGCADTSASMTWVGKAPDRPFDIGLALTAFMSEIAAPPYRNLSMSFSTTPRIFSFEEHHNVFDRIKKIQSEGCYGSTNYLGLHEAMLQLCTTNKVPQEELPVLVIFSDGHFDSMVTTHNTNHRYNYSYNTPSVSSSTTHENVIKMWVKAGYKAPPQIVYWNLAGDKTSTQVHSTMKGVQLLSGSSPSNMKYILYGEVAEEVTKTIIIDGKEVTITTKDIDPYTTVRIALDQPYFDPIRKILDKSTEKSLSHYKFDPNMHIKTNDSVSRGASSINTEDNWSYSFTN